MKDRKKPRRTKAKVQAYKKRLAYIGTAIIVTVLVVIIAVSSFLIYSSLNPTPNQNINPDQTNNPTYQLKTAIIDHLSLTAPNQTFKQTATNALKQAGHTVDYYSGEKVNVEFYRNLPTHGYELIILRVHSTAKYGQLFTSEPYSNAKYVHEQLADRVIRCSFYGEPPFYFAISPLFVKFSMNGNFQNTVIIMMGCDGLKNTDMAQAFIEKGAKVYISWSESVLAGHTDQATAHLLKHLLAEKQTIEQAVTETMKEVGPDPEYNSLLIYYPLEVGDQTIEDITGNPSANT